MLHWFAETTLVVSGLAVLAALASRWGRLGPGARHVLWVILLAKLVTPPLYRLPIPAEWPGVGSAEWFDSAVSRTVVPASGPPATTDLATPQLETTESDNQEALASLSGLLAGSIRPVVRTIAPVQAPKVEPSPVDHRPSTLDHRSSTNQPTIPATPVASGSSVREWLGHRTLARGLIGAWAIGAVCMLLADLTRIVRFARRVARGETAPSWVGEELRSLAARLRVRTPRATLVPGVGTPLLWCLGQPQLIVPPELLDRLDRERWRGILAHELAHVRRRDPWVGRAVMVAGWVWWWNPLFWLVKSRLETEAELACDAWVLWALPGGRRQYAEALVDVCATFSEPVAPVPSPAWGVGGAGRSFERRLTMILKSRGKTEPPRAMSLAAGLLALVALPTWSIGQDEPRPPRDDDRPRAERREGEADREREGDRERSEAERRASEQEERARAAVRRARESADRLRDSLDRDDNRDSPEATDRREAIEREMKAAQARLQDAQKLLQARMQEIQRRMQEEMRDAHEELQKAQRELMELRQQLSREGGQVPPGLFGPRGPQGFFPGFPSPPAPPEAGRPGDPPRAPEPPRPPGHPEGHGNPFGDSRPAATGDLESRVGELEQKFDTILEELRALRREIGDRGDSGRGRR